MGIGNWEQGQKKFGKHHRGWGWDPKNPLGKTIWALWDQNRAGKSPQTITLGKNKIKKNLEKTHRRWGWHPKNPWRKWDEVGTPKTSWEKPAGLTRRGGWDQNRVQRSPQTITLGKKTPKFGKGHGDGVGNPKNPLGKTLWALRGGTTPFPARLSSEIIIGGRKKKRKKSKKKQKKIKSRSAHTLSG